MLLAIARARCPTRFFVGFFFQNAVWINTLSGCISEGAGEPDRTGTVQAEFHARVRRFFDCFVPKELALFVQNRDPKIAQPSMERSISAIDRKSTRLNSSHEW